jgi:hypothetical protein
MVNANWLSQTRLATFTLDHSSPIYDTKFEGYNIEMIAGADFDRFSGSFLWNLTRKQKVNGITLDKFVQSDATPSLPDELQFMRMGKYLKFHPDAEGMDIQFYYQTSFVAYKELLPKREEFVSMTDGDQVPYHDAKLLLRGALVQFARSHALDTASYEADYKKYLDKCIVDEAPAATIKFMSSYAQNYLGRFPFIGG